MNSDDLAQVLAAIDEQPRAREAVYSADTGRSVTFGELRRSSDDVASRLADGHYEGALVAVTPASPIEAIELVIGALRARRPFLPLDPRLPQEAARRLLACTGALRVGHGVHSEWDTTEIAVEIGAPPAPNPRTRCINRISPEISPAR